jgi:hypothetical protein
VIDFLTTGSDYFPGWLSILFSLGLALGVVHHVPCLVRGLGNRWFHTGHVVMSLSMIYMYLSMSYDWTWLPGMWQMWFFVATSAVVGGYLVGELVRGRPVNFSWVLLLVGHVAMIYMWFPMMRWNAIAIFVLVSWFAIETFGWAANLFPDDSRAQANRRWFPYEVGARRVAASTAEHPGSVTTVAENHCHDDVLISSSWQDRAAMGVMALSMGYMFYGMELLRWMAIASMM